MRMMQCSLAVLAVFVFSAFALSQDKPKKPGDAPGELFFTGKGGQPFALDKVYPGITAALQLTDDQKLALQEAMANTVQSEKVRAAGAAAKSNPDTTQEQRDAAKKLNEDARKQLGEQVAQVLTAEQKALIAKIQQAFEEARADTAKAFEAEYGAAKGDKSKAMEVQTKAQAQTREEFSLRLIKFLTPDQKAAVDAAAMRQMEREAEATKKKKGI